MSGYRSHWAAQTITAHLLTPQSGRFPLGAVVLGGWPGRKMRARDWGAAAGLSAGPVAGPAAAGE